MDFDPKPNNSTNSQDNTSKTDPHANPSIQFEDSSDSPAVSPIQDITTSSTKSPANIAVSDVVSPPLPISDKSVTPVFSDDVDSNPSMATLESTPTQPDEQAASGPLGVLPGAQGNAKIFNSDPAGTTHPEAPLFNSEVTPLIPKRKRPKAKVLFIALIAIFVLAGSSAAAYFGYIVPNRPENVMETAFYNTFLSGQISSLNFNSKLSFTPSGSQAQNISITGAIDHSGKLDISASYDAVVTTITLHILSPDGQAFYFEVGGLDGLSNLLGYGADPSAQQFTTIINEVNNQWYEINPSLVQTIENSTGASTTTHHQLTASDKQKIKNAYQQNQFFTISQTLPSEAIDGTNSYHYKGTINENKLLGFLRSVASIDSNDSPISASTLNKILGSDSSTNANINTEVWVAKDTKYIDQIYLGGNVASGTSTSVHITFSKFNQPVSVSAPANAKSILQLLGSSNQDLTPLINSFTQGFGGSGNSQSF